LLIFLDNSDFKLNLSLVLTLFYGEERSYTLDTQTPFYGTDSYYQSNTTYAK